MNMNPFGPFYSIQFVLLLLCAGGYYKAAEVEDAPALLWAGMSAGVFLLTWRVFGWATLGNLLGQVALLAGITLVRLLLDKNKPA
jgi:uncharacterized membrane protein YdcZ (DUF606 family)